MTTAWLADAQAWAEHEFGSVALGNVRRTRRLVGSTAAIARHPAQSFPQIFDWNGLRGFDGVDHRKEVLFRELRGQLGL